MSFFEGKNIAILGGSGTLGKALIRQLSVQSDKPEKVIIFSRDEIKQLEMMDEFDGKEFSNIEYHLGDVRDRERLVEVLKEVHFVIHAAALKHVVMAENNPGECWKTNVEGTRNVIEACLINGVEKALLISTDKANNPIGVYGKSKAEAEKMFEETKDLTSFGILRLGNIIGARGSVFEAFERQRKTGVIKVTHPNATRFCISKEDASKFVLETLASEGGGIHVPEMKSISIVELAREIAPECRIEIIGLRPGDRLHEELNGISSSSVVSSPVV